MTVSTISQRFNAKSSAVLLHLQTRMERILLGWLLIAGLACAVRIAMSPLKGPIGLAVVLPYFLLVIAPVVSFLLAMRWFSADDKHAQPQFRLARAGRWRTVDPLEARQHRLYGTGGMMVSLLIGMLLNVPIRALEYLGAMPAVSGAQPPWLIVLHTMMTLDVVLMTSLYAIAFVAALRHVPLFPRLLVAIWCLDLMMQVLTAVLVASTPGLPANVAGALDSLLGGNVQKVLISMALWLPYLLLSRRVNVTYRSRVAVRD